MVRMTISERCIYFLGFLLFILFLFVKDLEFLVNREGLIYTEAVDNRYIGLRECTDQDIQQGLIRVSKLKRSVYYTKFIAISLQFLLYCVDSLILIELKGLESYYIYLCCRLARLTILNFQVRLDFLYIIIFVKDCLVVVVEAVSKEGENFSLVLVIFCSLLYIL